MMTEADVEDMICDSPESIWAGNVDVVGRQLVMPDGTRLDVLLAVRERDVTRVVVVEVKRDELQVDAIDQVLGYMRHLRRLLGGDEALISGVLVGRGASDKVYRIVGAIPSIEIVTYVPRVDFDAPIDCHPSCPAPAGLEDAKRYSRPHAGDDKCASEILPLWFQALERLSERLDPIPALDVVPE